MIEDFRPDDTGVSPLARHEEWYYAPCPVCGKRGRRETDVSDTFLDSAWYYLRYPSTEFADRPFDPARTKKWLPVTSYIGGNEHAVLHLLYSRFVTMVLHDLGLPRLRRAVPEVPGPRADREGRRQDVEVAGQRRRARRVHRPVGRRHLPDVPDVLGPFQEGGDFRDEGISGPRRFLDKVWALVGETVARRRSAPSADPAATHSTARSLSVQVKHHQTIKKVTDGYGAAATTTPPSRR